MIHRTLRTTGRNLLIALMNTAAFPAAAQDKDEGRHVRVSVQSPEFTGIREGTLMPSGPGHLSLLDAGTRAVADLPLDVVTKVEMRYEHRATRKGLLIGLLTGAGLAMLGSSLADSNCERYPPNSGPLAAAYNRECDSQERRTQLTIVGFLVIPTGVGAGLGSLIKSHSWSEVPSQRFQLSLRPERDGVSATLQFSF